MAENMYDFRKFLDTIHQKDLRDFTLVKNQNETEINGDFAIVIPADASDFIKNTAMDFVDYLFVSMNESLRIISGETEQKKVIRLTVNTELKVKRSFRLTCSDDVITIEGADERGIAMGCYYMESVMTMREAPFIPHTNGLLKEPLFTPRMVHSAYGMDVFTENYLKRVAHAGYDTVLVYLRNDANHGSNGPCDFTHLIDMAEAAGLDVYLYSGIKNIYHPSDPEAKAFYEAQYGNLFRKYPKAKGLVLVGESCQFPSHDPNTTQKITGSSECCFRPGGKASPGWWPCNDFPEFVTLLRDSVHKYAPDADIVFWTYNWAYAPKDLRIKLIENLPRDVTVELNFAMHDSIKIWGTQERALDYTLSTTGPSQLFCEEGGAAKQRDMKLYAMCNTAGKTWDIGAAPYLPAPQQWGKLMENLLAAKKDFGLQGLMETHHYGWYPSVISDLAQWMYWSNGPTLDEALHALAARDFSHETADTVVKVWNDWSYAISQFITPIEDQYGPCRVGPTYPLIFEGVSLRLTFGMPMTFPWTESCKYKIAFPVYQVVNDPDGLDMGIRRVKAEIKHLPEVIALWNNGADKLESLLADIPERKHANCRKMIAIARYIANTLTTTLHVKQWWVENRKLVLEDDPVEAEKILERIIRIANDEIENARNTIPLVRENSMLGYEPSMDYVTSEAQLEWKIRQVQSVLELDIPKYRKGIEVAEQLEKE